MSQGHFDNHQLSELLKFINKESNSEDLVPYIKKYGWFKSPETIPIRNDRVVKQLKFKGYCDFRKGLYYGQTLNGQRDGYGVLVCTNTDDMGVVIECEWLADKPIRGRRIIETCYHWDRIVGQFDEVWDVTGEGKYRNDSRTYKGQFVSGVPHGIGRDYNGGEYEEGQYVNDTKVGVFKYYSEKKELISLRTYNNGKLEQEEYVNNILYYQPELLELKDNQFKQEMLDLIIKQLKMPFNNEAPKLDKDDESEFTQTLKDIGWYKNPLEIQPDPQRIISWKKIQGHILENQKGKLFQGGIYYGQLINDQPDGYGIFYTTIDYWPYLYECQWVSGVPDKGRYIYGGSEVYEGQIDNNFGLTGEGTYYNKETLQKYQGQWKNGKYHGIGKFFDSDGDIYIGQWKKGKRDGYGKIIYQFGSSFEGIFKKDKQPWHGKKVKESGNFEIDFYDKIKNRGIRTCYHAGGKMTFIQVYQEKKKQKRRGSFCYSSYSDSSYGGGERNYDEKTWKKEEMCKLIEII